MRAGATQAGTVIMLHPSGCSQPRAAEALKAATIVSLSALNPNAAVVVQMPARVPAAMDYVTMLQVRGVAWSNSYTAVLHGLDSVVRPQHAVSAWGH